MVLKVGFPFPFHFRINLISMFTRVVCSRLVIVYDRDPELVKRIGAATALEVRATGIPYVFAPCIAVSLYDNLFHCLNMISICFMPTYYFIPGL